VLREADLMSHFKDAHGDLAQQGLTLGQDPDSGKLVGNVKDTLLSQMMVFMLTNKCQIRRFMIDYEEEEAELLRKEILKLADYKRV
jgi:hypothetical protein